MAGQSELRRLFNELMRQHTQERPVDYDELIRLAHAAERGEEPPWDDIDPRFVPGLRRILAERGGRHLVDERVYAGLPRPHHDGSGGTDKWPEQPIALEKSDVS
jgi:hypothetical protein